MKTGTRRIVVVVVAYVPRIEERTRRWKREEGRPPIAKWIGASPNAILLMEKSIERIYAFVFLGCVLI